MFLQDLRFALRTLRNSPGYALVAMVSLALGFGANSTIFSLADGLLLRPLPIAEPGDVVTIRGVTPSDTFAGVSYRDYADLRDNAKSFDGLVAFAQLSFGYAESPDALPQVKAGLAVSGNFFPAMGVTPQLGRMFRPEEDQAPGRDAVAVLSHDLWQTNFNGDPSVLGRKIRLNGIDFTVIGVTAAWFTGMDQYLRPSLYVPAHMAPSLLANQPRVLVNRGNRLFTVKGRLKNGVSVKQAEAELAGIAAGLAWEYPDTNSKYSVVVRTELQQRIERSPPDAMLIAILLGMVGVVLLIACANVTNLMLSRARARSREVAVRIALGAGRPQLIRQLLTESLIIALGGAVLGIGLANWGVAMLRGIEIPTDLPVVISIQLDARVFAFTLLVAVVSALLSGLAPAFQSSKADLTTALKAGDQGSSERKRLFGRNALVVMQVALSMVLLIASSMMVRALAYLMRTNPGFRTDHILTLTFDPALLRYSQTQANSYYQRLVEIAQAVPGVKSVALSSVLPMGNQLDGFDVAPEGHTFQRGAESLEIFGARVDENYFDTFAVRLQKGRTFQRTDTATSPPVAIVNEEFAKRYLQGQPVGKRLRVNGGKEWMEVVGVVDTTPVMWIAEPPTPFLYVPFRQSPRMRMKLLVHTSGDSAAMTAPLREAIRTIDPNQPVYDIRTIESFYQMRVIGVTTVITQVFSAAGLMGLALSLVGLYGLVSYSVSRRTREIGIRMAIGAERTDVLRMILRQGVTLSLVGISLGMLGGIGAGKVMEAAFQMPAIDPLVFASVPLGLFIVTLLATLVPARRAARVEPLRALRWE